MVQHTSVSCSTLISAKVLYLNCTVLTYNGSVAFDACILVPPVQFPSSCICLLLSLCVVYAPEFTFIDHLWQISKFCALACICLYQGLPATVVQAYRLHHCQIINYLNRIVSGQLQLIWGSISLFLFIYLFISVPSGPEGITEGSGSIWIQRKKALNLGVT